MTAQEARKLATTVITETESAILKRLEDRIRFAAENGNFSIGEAESIPTAVRTQLEKRGFKIQEINDRDGYWVTVSWKN